MWWLLTKMGEKNVILLMQNNQWQIWRHLQITELQFYSSTHFILWLYQLLRQRAEKHSCSLVIGPIFFYNYMLKKLRGTQLCGTKSLRDKDSVHQQLQSVFYTVFYQICPMVLIGPTLGSHSVMLVIEVVTRYSTCIFLCNLLLWSDSANESYRVADVSLC